MPRWTDNPVAIIRAQRPGQPNGASNPSPASRDASGATTMYGYGHDELTTNIRGPATGACPGSMHEGVDAMGRGRQKAKQTKVARQLKYYSPNTDYTALQRELAGSSGHASASDEEFLDDEQDDGELDDDDDDAYGWSAGGQR